jgi:hypothetical protein
MEVFNWLKALLPSDSPLNPIRNGEGMRRRKKRD